MLDSRISGDTATVFLRGELDHNAAKETKDALDAVISDRRIKNLVLDMKNLAFMDSSGLGVIMGRYQRISKRNGRISVKNVPAPIDRVFSISGIYSIIKKL